MQARTVLYGRCDEIDPRYGDQRSDRRIVERSVLVLILHLDQCAHPRMDAALKLVVARGETADLLAVPRRNDRCVGALGRVGQPDVQGGNHTATKLGHFGERMGASSKIDRADRLPRIVSANEGSKRQAG